MNRLLVLLFSFFAAALMFAQPNPPTDLTAVEVVFGQQKYVRLTWQYPLIPHSYPKFNIYRKEGAVSDTGSFIKKYPLVIGKSFNDKQVQSGKTYSYYVTTVTVQGKSGASDTVEITLSPPPPMASISGFIFDEATNNPLYRARVIFVRENGTNTPGFFTDSLGNFTANIPPGSYFMHTGAFHYKPEFYDNSPTIQNAQLLTFEANTSYNFSVGLEAYVPPVFYSLKGRVTDSLNNPVRSFVRVIPIRNNTHFQPRPGGTFTDSLGYYSLNVREGDSVIVFCQPKNFNFLPMYYDNKFSFNEADRILINGNIENINFVLQHKPVFNNGIAGSVSDTLNQPIESHITAYKLNFPRKKYFAVTDSVTGLYNFANLVPGYYILLAKPHSGYKPTYFRYDGTQTLNWMMADSVLVTEAGIVENINFTVLPISVSGFAKVSGAVNDSKGLPVSGAYVIVKDLKDVIIDHAITTSDGRYIVNGLTPGEYLISADLMGFNNSSSSMIYAAYEKHASLTADIILDQSSPTDFNSGTIAVNNFELFQNYPNPFNPATIINFQIPVESHVTLKIFNLLGKEIATLIDGNLTAGKHQIDFSGEKLSSGVYFYRIDAGGFTSTKKLMLMK
jgi:hypothetical protein